jgi:beta-galactosidase
MSEKRFSRREFMGASLATAATAIGAGALHLPGEATTAEMRSQPEIRTRANWNEGWNFRRQASPGSGTEPEFVGAEQPGFSDSGWEDIWLPHTWDATPDNPFVTSGHFHGVGWYRKRFEAPESWRDRRVLVHFNGAFQTADAWVNGRHVGKHVGGYTSFAFDITDAVEAGRANLLTVKVDDMISPFIAPAEERNVATYGGIYRSVWVEVTDPLHVGYNGTWVTLEGNEAAPVVRIRTWVVNQGQASRTFRLESKVVDAAGNPKAKLEARAELASNKEGSFDQRTGVITSPQLWSPDSPSLYRVESTIWDGDRAVDHFVTRFGIRYMRHDARNGFTLNGKPINLHGVDRRQDYGFLGDALPEAVGVRDVRLMKEMGVNFFRTAHYPQDVAVLDACDEMGILVWEEVPNIAIHIYPPPEDETEPVYTTRFPWPLMENLKQQLKEMIERDRNRPSVIIWGFADDLSEYQFPEDFAELSDYTHSIDATRWTAGRAPHVTDIVDATTFDYLWGEHEKHPERMYIWNEWGAIPCERDREGPALIAHHGVPGEAEGDRIQAVSDSMMSLIQEGFQMQWNAMPWLGMAKWCMFDCGEVNGTVSRSLWTPPDDKLTLRWPFNDYLGISDMWRLPKSAYFFFQSQWTEKPMVHIVGHWTWPKQSINPRQVRIYSNCDSVELLLNGESLGVHQPASQERVWADFCDVAKKYSELRNDQFARRLLPGAHLAHPPFVWDDVSFRPGTLIARGRKGSTITEHQLQTAGESRKILLNAEKQTLAADAMDVSFIRAAVVDKDGTVVPSARPWISFTLQGPGRLLGGAATIDAITGLAAINVQSTGEPGEIIVQAASAGLDTGSVRVLAVRAPV